MNQTILKLLIPFLLISAVAGSPLSSAMLKYDTCPIPDNIENPKELSDYINTLSYDYDKAELVNMGVNTYKLRQITLIKQLLTKGAFVGILPC